MTRGHRLFPRHFSQAAAFDQLHGEVRLAFVLADLVDGNDVGMLETGRGLSFMAKSFYERFAGKLASEEHFERDHSVQTELVRAINHAHATTRDFGDEFIVAQRRARSRRSAI